MLTLDASFYSVSFYHPLLLMWRISSSDYQYRVINFIWNMDAIGLSQHFTAWEDAEEVANFTGKMLAFNITLFMHRYACTRLGGKMNLNSHLCIDFLSVINMVSNLWKDKLMDFVISAWRQWRSLIYQGQFQS